MIRVYDHGSTYGISIGAQELWAFCLGRPGSGLEQIKGLRLSGWTGKAGRGTLLALEEGVDSGSWGSPLCGDFGVHPTSSPFSTPTLVPSQFPVGDSRNPTDAPPLRQTGTNRPDHPFTPSLCGAVHPDCPAPRVSNPTGLASSCLSHQPRGALALATGKESSHPYAGVPRPRPKAPRATKAAGIAPWVVADHVFSIAP